MYSKPQLRNVSTWDSSFYPSSSNYGLSSDIETPDTSSRTSLPLLYRKEDPTQLPQTPESFPGEEVKGIIHTIQYKGKTFQGPRLAFPLSRIPHPPGVVISHLEGQIPVRILRLRVEEETNDPGP